MKYYFKENVKAFLPDGDLYNEKEEVVYHFENTTLFFPDVYLSKDGKKIGHVKKKFNWFIRTYEIYLNDQLVDILNQDKVLKQELTLQKLGWKVKGDLMGFTYTIEEDDKLIGKVDQEIDNLKNRSYVEIIDESKQDLLMLVVLAIYQLNHNNNVSR